MSTGRHGQPDHSSLGGEAAFGGVVAGIPQRLRGETAHAAELPSPKDGARCLGGYASKARFIRFPGPGRDRKDRSCTVKFDPNAPDGFVVADARKEINGLDLKDYVKERWACRHSLAPAKGARMAQPTAIALPAAPTLMIMHMRRRPHPPASTSFPSRAFG